MAVKNWSRWASLDFWLTLVGSLALIALAFWGASKFIAPAPPGRIVMTVGQEGGAYEGLAKDLQLLLAQSSVKLELRTTRGAREDLDLLNDPNSGVTLAVVQGGVATEADGNDLMSLASLYREPVWVFHRQGLKLDRLSGLKGRSLSIGPQGSGVRTLSVQLLKANGVDEGNTHLADLPSEEAAQQLIDRKLDAIMVVGAPESNLIHKLMKQSGVRLMDFAQAEAYSRQFPFLARMVLPMGSFDLIRNIPDHDVTLVAPTANLVVRDDIHPALIDLLMEVATDISSDASMLHREGEFPSPKGVDIPLSDDAARYMKNGPSFLHKYLPFWIAVWADRLLVLLIPVVAVLVPVVRLAPAAYAWRVKSRIYRWYGKLKQLEFDLDLEGSQLDKTEAMKRLDDIERGVSHIRTPLAFSENLYNLRAHIELVRHRLSKLA
ncbi:MAG TPA: TAXI family TRAP transporter solute-binding subunit [Aquabacterium sp.]|uniref:TAXI family TRAP transporter solute-binding subunit n=1 Tax=Aquabacterium sp. TaxID=1872578 RepID=UPI002E34E337|nr:TAXI family TRAP transporter solute-binding subunit [Aquabacterium sp.]HEX5355062.1 TAXI family TRAP transporter solute-binding subunit [Aquabacterium sp.]